MRPIEPEQEGERRIRLRRPAPTRYLQVAYQAPSATSEDAFPMIVLDAILSGAKGMGMGGGRAPMGRSSRLYRALVDTGLASSARSGFALTHDPFVVDVNATLRPGVELADAERALFAVIDALATDGPTEQELTRAKKGVRAQVGYGTETVTSQAYWLGSLECVASYQLFDQILDAGRRGRGGRRAAGRGDLPDRAATDGWLARAGRGGRVSAALSIDRRTLPNGLVLLGHANPVSPAVIVRVMIRTGAVHDQPERAGTARLTGSMLQRGTARHSFEELNELTDSQGVAVTTDVGRQTTDVTVKCLVEDLDFAIGVLREVIREPTFPAAQLEKVRGELMTGLREADQDTRSVAERTFRELAYPEGHPFRRRVAGYLETVPRIAVDDLTAHHAGPSAPT